VTRGGEARREGGRKKLGGKEKRSDRRKRQGAHGRKKLTVRDHAGLSARDLQCKASKKGG